MNLDLEPAKAFGTLLRENEQAAQYYDNCAPAQKQAILLRLNSIPLGEMPSFVEQLGGMGTADRTLPPVL